MKETFLIFFLIVVGVLADKYAIVFQGDAGYDNYSDSSNTCRAYNDIFLSGIPRENIIYMANDKIHDDAPNPFPGKLFTLPDPEGEGWDHAKDCKEHYDYTIDHISPKVVLAIIAQDEEKVKELTGLENPKVFHTTEEDTILIYYSDHGYEGGVGCGGSTIKAEEIQETLKTLHDNKKYDKLAFFLEACESGSVFDTLPDNLNIYAFTSANRTEDAWCEYCPPEDVVNGESFYVCLSMYYDNEFQRLWEEESTTITLGELFQRTHDHVAKSKDQEVSEWGDLKMRDLPMTTFLGDKPIKLSSSQHSMPSQSFSRVELSAAPLHNAKWAAIRGKENAEEKLRAVVSENVKREIETMRMAAYVLGEKEMNAKLDVDTEVYNASCAAEVFEALMKECGQSMPFPKYARNLVHAMCHEGKTLSIDWSEICM